MTTSAVTQAKCFYCGSFPHPGVCPTVKAMEYHPDGSIKRVEFKTATDYPQQVLSMPSVFRIGDTPAGSSGTQFADKNGERT